MRGFTLSAWGAPATPSAADPVMPRAAEPAPVRTAGGLFDRREVLRLSGKRRRAALDLGVSAGNKRPDRQSRRTGEPDDLPTHRLPPRDIFTPRAAKVSQSPPQIGSGSRALRNHNAAAVLACLATRQKCRYIPGVGPKSEARRSEHSFRRRGARCLPRKILSRRVADRRVKIVPVERYRLSFVEAVDYLAGADPILVRLAKVVA